MTKHLDYEAATRRARAVRAGIEPVDREDRSLSPRGYLPATDGTEETDFDPQEIAREALRFAAEENARTGGRSTGKKPGQAVESSKRRSNIDPTDPLERAPDGTLQIVQRVAGVKSRKFVVEFKSRVHRKKP